MIEESIIKNAHEILRESNRKIYSFEDTKNVLCYFMQKYKAETGKEHPGIDGRKLMYIIGLMPYFNYQTEQKQLAFDIQPEEYKKIIDLYFRCNEFTSDCDYQIAHFFSGKIRMMRKSEMKKRNKFDSAGNEYIPMPDYVKKMSFYQKREQ